MRRSIPILAWVALTAAMLACATPLASSTVVPVETGVALTLQAMAAAATPAPSSEPALLPTASQDALPHDLYFRNLDGGGLWQIYRMGTDGRTIQQITFELLNVDEYDVSPADGNIAYVTNNQMYLVDKAGAGRRLLIDGGPLNDDNRWTNGVSAPVWSADGKTLAYGHGGLSFLDPVNGAVSRVLQNQIDTTPGFPLVKEIYVPEAYSPDGTKLLIQIGFYEGGSFGIYLPANNALVRFHRSDGGMVCCYVHWIPDGTGVYITSPTLGMAESGLYHADAATGNVTELLPGSPPDGTYNFAFGAQVGTDDKLYFFFSNLPQIPTDGETPLYLVRSAPDGVTDRTQLTQEAFQKMDEVLWAPDASLAVVVLASNPSQPYGGEARLVYPDGRASAALTSFARDLRWGP